jgi:hypothetical protein
MKMNYLVLGLTALIPLVVGFIWYHPKVFGNAWMKSLGFTEDKMKEGFNMPLVFGLTYLFSFFLAFALQSMVIHQIALYQLTMHFEKDPATQELLGQIMSKYGTEFRNIHHGLLHGFIGGLTIAFPIVAINALFERRSWKYIFMNAGYWIVSMMLMGAVICKFA